MKNLFILVFLIVTLISSGCVVNNTVKDDSDIIIDRTKIANGILINEVKEGGPAQKAGIRQGDVIVSYDGKSINDMETLEKEISEAPPGKKVILEVLRGDSLFNVGLAVKKKGWKIANLDPSNEFPDYAVNLISNVLWIGTFPYPVELNTVEQIRPPYSLYDPDHLPANPPTIFTIIVR